MQRIVKDLLHKSREAEKIWRKMAGENKWSYLRERGRWRKREFILLVLLEKEGVDVLSKRSEESFSINDWLYWIKDLSCLIYAKWKTMSPITYPLTEGISNKWSKEIYGIKGAIVPIFENTLY